MRKLRKMAIGVLSSLLISSAIGSIWTDFITEAVTNQIAIGEKIEGNLTDENWSRQHNAFSTFYYLENSNECKRVSISFKSDAFYTYMYVYRQVDGKNVYVGKNDDKNSSTLNSAFEIDVEKGGKVAIEVISYYTGENSSFTLEVKELKSCAFKANLFLSDVKVTPENPNIGQVATFTAKINVEGNIPLAERKRMTFEFYLSKNQNELNAEDTGRIPYLLKNTVKAGWSDGDIVKVRAFVRNIWWRDGFLGAAIDVDNKIKETNEDDNRLLTSKQVIISEANDNFILTNEINNNLLLVTGNKLPMENTVHYMGTWNRQVDLSFEAENVYEKYTVHFDWNPEIQRFYMRANNPHEKRNSELDISHLEDGLWKLTIGTNQESIPKKEFYFYKWNFNGWNW